MNSKEYFKKFPFLGSIAISVNKAIFPAKVVPSPGRSELLSQLEPIGIDVVPSILDIIGELYTNPSFVKVGANDGLTGDPCGDLFLRNNKWQGLLIEPVDYCAIKLRDIYSDQSRFIIEQSAIGQRRERRTFYFMAKEAIDCIPELPEWYDQLGSFSREHIIKHFDVDVEEFIREKEIVVSPLSNILRRRGFVASVFLQIDVEGFDYEVLKSLNFRKSRPDMILVEHKHLSASDLLLMQKLLKSKRYLLLNTGKDLVALSEFAVKTLKSTHYLPAGAVAS
jgi:FkbM family methyltransferase